MATRIRLKNSTVLNKAPLSADLEIGELAINANVGSPGAYIKDSADNIIKIAGSGVGEIPTLQEVTDEGAVTTQEITAAKFIGNGSQLTAIDLQQVTTAGTVTTTGATFGGTVTANLFSGSLPYSDLTGTPTIPTDNSQLTNGAGYYKSGDSPSFATVTATVFDLSALPSLP